MTTKSLETIGSNKALTAHKANGKGIVWAIVDSGIDGSHDHFKKHKNLELPPPLRHRSFSEAELKRGAVVEIDEEESAEDALVDVYGHGTHIAGIVAGELSAREGMGVESLGVKSMRGIAPLAKLLSVKILSKKRTMQYTEFAFLKALEWLIELNKKGKPAIHGVMVGVNFPVEVRNFACGHSPVCDAVNKVVQAGMVVVAPAGNLGYKDGSPDNQFSYGLSSSITDPGNAELAITVGATHRFLPQQYGASFFSSRGPTLDGRFKPDLLAPGETITSCAVGREGRGKSSYSTYQRLDGTSVAAAHVAGAAAALLSVRRELIGKPQDVKQILMDTATDLQRTRQFQGAGLVNLEKAVTHKLVPGRKSAKKLAAELPPLKSERHHEPQYAQNPADANVQSSKRFVVAFSYSGKHEATLVRVVGEVRRRAVLEPRQVFYAPDHKAALSQPDLDKKLKQYYFEDSELVVVFLGQAYQESEWCGLEWRTILRRARKEGGDRIMLLRFDDGEVDGLKSTDGYIDIRGYQPAEIALEILDRLELVRTNQSPRAN